jgi:hypothetical protein
LNNSFIEMALQKKITKARHKTRDKEDGTEDHLYFTCRWPGEGQRGTLQKYI